MESSVMSPMVAREVQRWAQLHSILITWAVYDRPSDFPDHFIARPYLSRASGVTAMKWHLVGSTLQEIRDQLPFGLVLLDRNPDDDPTIKETWI